MIKTTGGKRGAMGLTVVVPVPAIEDHSEEEAEDEDAIGSSDCVDLTPAVPVPEVKPAVSPRSTSLKISASRPAGDLKLSTNGESTSPTSTAIPPPPAVTASSPPTEEEPAKKKRTPRSTKSDDRKKKRGTAKIDDFIETGVEARDFALKLQKISAGITDRAIVATMTDLAIRLLVHASAVDKYKDKMEKSDDTAVTIISDEDLPPSKRSKKSTP